MPGELSREDVASTRPSGTGVAPHGTGSLINYLLIIIGGGRESAREDAITPNRLLESPLTLFIANKTLDFSAKVIMC